MFGRHTNLAIKLYIIFLDIEKNEFIRSIIKKFPITFIFWINQNILVDIFRNVSSQFL